MITEYLARRTRLLFLIDASGALVTAFFLGIVWQNFRDYTGMPHTVLSYLALLALLLSVYSLSCFLFLKDRRCFFLKLIAVANLFYSGLSLAFMVFYYTRLTMIGKAYFLSELLIITALAYLEFKVADKIRKSSTAAPQ